MTRMKFLPLAYALLSILLSAYSASAFSQQADPALTRIVIKVGAGIRPPFLIESRHGMGPEIINVFNVIQEDFYFELIATAINRRVQSINEGWVDIIMWDNIEWGWESNEIDISIPLLHSKDVFISRNAKNKSQAYFDTFKDRKVCAVNGYHYKLLNFSTNYNDIKSLYDLTLVRTEQESIKLVLNNRCDIGIASESAILWFYKYQQLDESSLLISEKVDTEYTRHFLIPQNAAISVEEINAILHKAHKLNLLAPIYKKYGQLYPFN